MGAVTRHLPADVYHAGTLVDTDAGVRFACARCCLLLDREGWARDCPGESQVTNRKTDPC